MATARRAASDEPLGDAGWSALLGYMIIQRRFDKELKSMLLTSATAAASTAERAIPSPSFSAAMRQARYNIYSTDVDDVLRRVWDSVYEITSRGVVAAEERGAKYVDETTRRIATLLPDAAAGRLGTATADAAVATLAQEGSQRPARLAARVARNRLLSASKVRSIVSAGIEAAKASRDIAREIFANLSPTKPGGTSFQAFRLMRSEMNNAFHEIQRIGFRDQPWVEGVQWTLSGSHPRADTCDDYAERDHSGLGRGIFLPRDVPVKPHPGCLCFLVVVSLSPSDFLSSYASGKFDSFLEEIGFDRDALLS